MHEYGLALQIIDTLCLEAKKRNLSKIKEVFLDIGKLLMVNPEQLKFSLEIVAKGTKAEGMKVHITFRNPKIKCENGHVSEINFPENSELLFFSELKCPKCNTPNFIFESGKELYIKRIIAE